MIVYVVVNYDNEDNVPMFCGAFDDETKAERYVAENNDLNKLYSYEIFKYDTAKAEKDLDFTKPTYMSWRFIVYENDLRMFQANSLLTTKEENSIRRYGTDKILCCITFDKKMPYRKAREIALDRIAKWKEERAQPYCKWLYVVHRGEHYYQAGCNECLVPRDYGNNRCPYCGKIIKRER